MRKSRDEENTEDVLIKHRARLTDIAEKNNWTYTIYEEIVTGESISKREEMKRLLSEVEAGRYDGVLVVAFDRLTRGLTKDFAAIEEAFLEYDTLIITPDREYDLANKNDRLMLGVLGLTSRNEYDTITERFSNGKLSGAKLGKWTNGKPPMPYYYDKNTRQVVVDETKRGIYRSIVDMYLSGSNLNDIAIWLSNNNIPTPYNIKPDTEGKRGWHALTVQRLLLSEIHMGYIVYGKTKSKRGRVEIVPFDEVIRVQGSHEVLKTEEEHNQIIAKLAKNRILNPNARRNELPLSGLLHCGKCSSKMAFRVGYSKGRGQYWSTLCVHRHKNGKRCEQTGRILDDYFFDALYEKIVKVDQQVLESLDSRNQEDESNRALINVKTKELEKQKRALDKIHESYEEQLISKLVYLDRKTVRENHIHGLENEIRELRALLTVEKRPTPKTELLDRIDEFKRLWNSSASHKEKNKAFKLLVEKIVYDRVDNEVTLTVFYK